MEEGSNVIVDDVSARDTVSVKQHQLKIQFIPLTQIGHFEKNNRLNSCTQFQTHSAGNGKLSMDASVTSLVNAIAS